MKTTELQQKTKEERLKEKISLARELGMEIWADTRDLDIKFKKISLEEISKKLNAGKIISKKRNTFNLYATFLWPIFVYGHVIFQGSMRGYIDHFLIASIGCLYWAIKYQTEVSNEKIIEVKRMTLELWEEDIPYGGLLAVKEAKKRGFEDFTIYYPVAQEKRVMEDPIIIGMKNNFRYEIFFWDEGKVYE